LKKFSRSLQKTRFDETTAWSREENFSSRSTSKKAFKIPDRRDIDCAAPLELSQSTKTAKRRRKMVKFELPAVTEIASKNGGDVLKKMDPPQKADSTALQHQQQQATEHLLKFFPALQQQLLAQHYFVRTCNDIEREICVNNVLDAANQSRCNALIALLHKNLTNDTLRQHQQRAMGAERPMHGILKPVTHNCANDDAAGTATQRKTKFFLRYKC
jgi:hypothetical protein